MPVSGYKIYWKRKKVTQDSTFNRIIGYLKSYAKSPIGSLKITKVEVEAIYKRRNLSKQQKEIILSKIAELNVPNSTSKGEKQT